MKKRWKIFWWSCGGLAIIGVICCITGVILGGASYGKTLKSWKMDDENFQKLNAVSSEIEGDEQKTFCGIEELDVEVSEVNVVIDEYNGKYLAVETSNIPESVLDEISYTADESELKIELKDSKKIKKLLSGNTEPTIKIKVPFYSLQEADISVDSGILQIGQIQTEELHVEVGAGQARVNRFVSDYAEFHCGAGEMQITGEADSTDIECGVGNVNYIVNGAENEYNYEVKSSIGKVSVGNDTSEGLNPKWRKWDDMAEKEINIECGLGEVRVEFKK